MPRCGAAALLLLTLGLYLVFPGCRVWKDLRGEKQTPRALETTTDRDMIDLNILTGIEGISRVTPVIRIDGALAAEDAKMNCQIQGVFPSYLELKFTRGGVFPDGSTMPFLVLNQAAAKAFTREDGGHVTVDAETEVTLTVGGSSQKAVICGIFRDGSEIPAAYMSYETARKAYPQSGSTNLLLYLPHRGDSERVIKALSKWGFTASAPENEAVRWELMENQYRMLFLVSAAFLLVAAMLTRERRKREDTSGEAAALLLSGMTASEVSAIFPLRSALTGIFSLFSAVTLAVVTGGFIPQGLLVSGFIACVYSILSRFTARSLQKGRESYLCAIS